MRGGGRSKGRRCYLVFRRLKKKKKSFFVFPTLFVPRTLVTSALKRRTHSCVSRASLAGRANMLASRDERRTGMGGSPMNTRNGNQQCCAWRTEDIGTVSPERKLGLFANAAQTCYDLLVFVMPGDSLTDTRKSKRLKRFGSVALVREVFSYGLFI